MVQKLIDILNLVTREQLSGIIRAFNTQQFEYDRFKIQSGAYGVMLFINRVMVLMMPDVLMNSVSLLIVWVGASKLNWLQYKSVTWLRLPSMLYKLLYHFNDFHDVYYGASYSVSAARIADFGHQSRNK